jgi:hypothetical protein
VGEIYPELIDYIFQYCGEFYTETERKAKDHHFGMVKFGRYPDGVHPKITQAKERFLTTDLEAIDLLKNGYSEFIINTATRIYKEHKNELDLNLCPRCGKIARTPRSKQCRFCSYDWH